MKIKVRHEESFGREYFYPNCKIGDAILRLMRHKSFTREDINQLKSVGFEFEVAKKEITV